MSIFGKIMGAIFGTKADAATPGLHLAPHLALPVPQVRIRPLARRLHRSSILLPFLIRRWRTRRKSSHGERRSST
jgi:hypothetical protein